jgi:hypothetical protein
MTCDETRRLLAEYVSGAMPAKDREDIASHLSRCSACQDECESLRDVSRLLDRSTAPPVQVDVPALYQETLRRERLRTRRWRRVALTAALAAGILLLIALIPLIRRETTPVVPVDPPTIVIHTSTPVNDDRLQRLEELTQALALDVQALHVKQQGEQTQLQNQLTRLREDVLRLRSVTEEDVTTLTRHIDFILKGKGETP